MKITVIFCLLFLSACSQSDSYTLYRNSVLDEFARYHIATFDSKDGEKYNQGNCDIAKDLFQKQDGVKTKFWCEKGAFRK
jgi:hypothetical protein